MSLNIDPMNPFYIYENKDQDGGRTMSAKMPEETAEIHDGIVVLKQIPDTTYSVIVVDSNNQPFTDRTDTNIPPSQLKPDEFLILDRVGFLIFNPKRNNETITVKEYYGKGYWLIDAARIMTELKENQTDGTFTFQTLDKLYEALTEQGNYAKEQAELAKQAREDIQDDLGKKADKASTLSGYGIADAYTKEEVNSRFSTVYKYKGTLQTAEVMPADNEIGDVYNIESNLFPLNEGLTISRNCRITCNGGELTIGAGLRENEDYFLYPKQGGQITIRYNSRTYTEQFKAIVHGDLLVTNNNIALAEEQSIEAAATWPSRGGVTFNSGDNVAWTGEYWDVLAGTVELSNYATKDEVNKKANKETVNGGFHAGLDSEAKDGGAVGNGANTQGGGAAGIGAGSKNGFSGGAYSNSTHGGAAGWNAATTDGFAGGSDARTEDASGLIDAIQLGTGVNPNKHTMKVYGKTIVENDGRLTDVGRLSELFTSNKKTIVSAINELSDGKSPKVYGNGGFMGGKDTKLNGTGTGGSIGMEAQTSTGGSVGLKAVSSEGGAVGSNAYSSHGAAVGRNATTMHGVAAGMDAKTVSGATAIDAVQLGTGTNAKPFTAQLYNYQLLESASNPSASSKKWLKDVGDISALNTADKANIVTAVNELQAGKAEKTELIGKKGAGEGAEVFNDLLDNTASGSYAHAEGISTNASGPFSHAEGTSARASGQSSHAEGQETIALGTASHAEGMSTATQNSVYAYQIVSVPNEGSHTVTLNTVNGIQAGDLFHVLNHATGEDYSTFTTTVSSVNAQNNTVTLTAELTSSNINEYAFTNTGKTSFNGAVSIVYGGRSAHAEGSEAYAAGSAAHAEGERTAALGMSAHAEGNQTKALNEAAHAEGNYTLAQGQAAHAEGNSAKAIGNTAHAEGAHTIAKCDSSHAQGKYNIEDTTGIYAHIVGNGSPMARSNAHTLDWDGNAWFAGKVEPEDYSNFDTHFQAQFDSKANQKTAQGGFSGGQSAYAMKGGAAGIQACTLDGGAAGDNSYSDNGGASGSNTFTSWGGAVGNSAHSTNGGAVGSGAVAANGFAGGENAKTENAETGAIDAIQLGTGTNSNPNSLQVYSYPLMDENGKIPADRLPYVSGTAVVENSLTSTSTTAALSANQGKVLKESVDLKVDKVSGKGLSANDYTTAEKTKLSGIATNANNYVHPATHVASIITQDATHRFVADTEKTTWNNKLTAANVIAGDNVTVTASGNNITITATDNAKRPARCIVGHVNGGATAADCDYLCDGTNDSELIESAISQCTTTGGKIIIREGTYTIDSTIGFSQSEGAGKITIQGNGNTILAGTINVTIMEIRSESIGMLIENICFQSSAKTNGCTGLSLVAHNANVQNCTFRNLGVGISMDDTPPGNYNNVISDNYFLDVGTAIDGYTYYTTICNNIFQDFKSGVVLIGGYNNIVSSNQFASSANGIAAIISTSSTDFIINGNYIKMSQGACCRVMGGTILSANNMEMNGAGSTDYCINTQSSEAGSIVSCGNILKGTIRDSANALVSTGNITR